LIEKYKQIKKNYSPAIQVELNETVHDGNILRDTNQIHQAGLIEFANRCETYDPILKPIKYCI